jgi:translation elongation factor EF-4
VDGVLVADQDGKARVVDDFYDQLLGSAPEHVSSLDLDYLGVQEHDLSKLEAPFSEEEVWLVIHSQEPDKAQSLMVSRQGSISCAITS